MFNSVKNRKVFAVVAVLLVAVSSFSFGMVVASGGGSSWADTDTFIGPGSMVSGAKSIIFKDDSGMTCLRNGTTGKIDSRSTNSTQIIASAVSKAGSVYIRSGLYEIIPDNSTARVKHDGGTTTWIFAGLYLASGCSVYGDGSSTVLKLGSGYIGSIMAAVNADDISISNLAFNGNRYNAGVITDVRNAACIYLENSGASSITNIVSSDAAWSGIMVFDSENVHISNCVDNDPYHSSIAMVRSNHWSVVGCSGDGAGNGSGNQGVHLTGCGYGTVTACSYDHYQNGIRTDGVTNNMTVIGNHVVNFTQYGLRFDDYSSHIIMSNNIVDSPVVANYAISIPSTCKDVIIDNNLVVGSKTSPRPVGIITTSGANVTISNNIVMYFVQGISPGTNSRCISNTVIDCATGISAIHSNIEVKLNRIQGGNRSIDANGGANATALHNVYINDNFVNGSVFAGIRIAYVIGGSCNSNQIRYIRDYGIEWISSTYIVATGNAISNTGRTGVSYAVAPCDYIAYVGNIHGPNNSFALESSYFGSHSNVTANVGV